MRSLRLGTFAVLSVFALSVAGIKVCKTFGDFLLPKSKQCYNNPDGELEAPQIIERYGYNVENHTVITKDGYILVMFRIIPRNSSRIGCPVFLQHGINQCSRGFLLLQKRSFAFKLADAGFDVWLGNLRGTTYSSEHVTLSSKQLKYWDFSFHEHGTLDLPAMLEYVYSKTNQKILYVGYSMGTTILYVYSSMYPEISAEILEVGVCLAPIAYLKHMKGSAAVLAPFAQPLKVIVDVFFKGAVLRRTPLFLKTLRYACTMTPLQMKFCYAILMSVTGFDFEQMSPEYQPVVLMQLFDPVCAKVLVHYASNRLSGGFRWYDHGPVGNLKAYGTKRPPSYDVGKISVPLRLIYGKNDWLSREQVKLGFRGEDVMKLYGELSDRARKYDMWSPAYDKFEHFDVAYGKDADKMLYDPVIRFLKSLCKS